MNKDYLTSYNETINKLFFNPYGSSTRMSFCVQNSNQKEKHGISGMSQSTIVTSMQDCELPRQNRSRLDIVRSSLEQNTSRHASPQVNSKISFNTGIDKSSRQDLNFYSKQSELFQKSQQICGIIKKLQYYQEQSKNKDILISNLKTQINLIKKTQQSTDLQQIQQRHKKNITNLQELHRKQIQNLHATHQKQLQDCHHGNKEALCRVVSMWDGWKLRMDQYSCRLEERIGNLEALVKQQNLSYQALLARVYKFDNVK